MSRMKSRPASLAGVSVCDITELLRRVASVLANKRAQAKGRACAQPREGPRASAIASRPPPRPQGARADGATPGNVVPDEGARGAARFQQERRAFPEG